MVGKFDPQAGANHINSAEPVFYTFSVEMAWKGVTTDTLEIQTALSSVSCGYPFITGNQYFVMARTGGECLRTGLCSGNAPLDQAWSARYLLPPPDLMVQGAAWSALTRDDLLGFLRNGISGEETAAASLLAEEFRRPGIRWLSLSEFFRADPIRSGEILSSEFDSLTTAEALVDLGFRLAESGTGFERAAAIQGLGVLTQGEELDRALRLGFSDGERRVRSKTRLVLVERHDDLSKTLADEHMARFISSIGPLGEGEEWIGVHQLRYFPDQKELIIPYLESLADTVSNPVHVRTVREVLQELRE